jgi:hypothetical protein
MKSRYKYSLILLMTLMVGFMWSSCSDDGDGTPTIGYVRVTNPEASDSLLASAGQGQMIAIIGSNLQSTREIWFNDQKANLVPTFVTSNSILVRIPSTIPGEVTNNIKLVFANGNTLVYDFSVDIGKPFIDHVRSEYVNEGDSVFLYGQYFYEPLTVSFGGGAQGEIISVNNNNDVLVVKMPAGVQPGPVTITNTFGQAESNFWMQDNRNIILDFENMSGPNGQAAPSTALWHPASGDFNKATTSAPGIPSINGNYLYNPMGVSGYGAWAWSEIWTGNVGAVELEGLKNIPAESLTNPKAYSLKFEVLTFGSLTGAYLNLYIGNNVGGVGRGPGATTYTWQPNINTNGVWQTVTVPWADVYSVLAFPYNANGYDISLVMQGPNAVPVQAFAMDNIRVVPNTNDE